MRQSYTDRLTRLRDGNFLTNLLNFDEACKRRVKLRVITIKLVLNLINSTINLNQLDLISVKLEKERERTFEGVLI